MQHGEYLLQVTGGMGMASNGQFPQDFDYEHNPSWRIFRIMAEFVDGFDFIARIAKSVTFFGSARLAPDHPYYQMARDLAGRLSTLGYSIVTGGGPGIMEAANRGAHDIGGPSIGLNIQLPMEQRTNKYVTESINFSYFFSRKVMLNFSAEAYIFFPGGFGTLDEFYDLVTLVQTGKHERNVPILLIGASFWEPLTQWMQREMLEKLHTIAPNDLTIFTVTDDIEEAVRIVEAGVAEQTQDWIAKRGRALKTPDDKLKQATRPMKGNEQ
jgi:uncharacterized protein (TIGR00730 family)